LTEYLTEQEQIEILKNWIKQYSFVILGGVLIAGIAIFGWRYWQERQHKILSHASSVYDEMLTVRAQNNREATTIQAKKLFSHYSQTSYGQMAAFMLARNAIVNKNYAEAEKQLQWVVNHSHIPAIRQIARIRLARVFIANRKPEESIKLLDKIDDKTFNGLTNEVKGDAYVTMKNTNMARQSYQQALNDLPNAEVIRPLLQMKYDNLSTAS
jgi:predicted negative regulator of RcsB-dependent stress response